MTNWPSESKQAKGTKLLLFLISPVLGFLHSLRSMNTKSSYWVFFFFAVCFGMAFSIDAYESASIYSSGIDAGRYRLEFEKSSNLTSQEFFRNLNSFMQFDDGDKDFYYITMVYLVSRFTHNYHFLFMAFAIVFAFFQLKSLKFLTQHEQFENSLFFLILAFFFTWNQIFNINAMRFYTAAWIGVYAIFQIFLKGRNRYFALLLIAPFFHSSFWLFDAVVVVAYLLKRLEYFWIVLFVISFFSSTVLAEIINIAADYLPDFLAGTARNYTDADRLFSDSTFTGSGFYWVPKMFDTLYKVYVNVLVVLLIFKRKELKASENRNLYLFVIIFMTYLNFAMPIPALGRRSIVMIYPLIAFLWMVTYKKQKLNWLIYIMPLVWFWQTFTYSNYYNTVLNLDFVLSPIYLVLKYLILA